MSVTLLIIENNIERFQVIDDPVFTIGRSTKNQVVLRELVSSRHHCEIRKVSDGEGHMLRDLGSRNGTQINGQFERMSLLRKGDKITIGSTHLYFNVTNRDEIVDQLPNKEEEEEPLLTSKEETRYEENTLASELSKLVSNLFCCNDLRSALQTIFDSIVVKTYANGGIIRLIPNNTERFELEDGDIAGSTNFQNLMDLLFQELLSQSEDSVLVESIADSEIFQDQEHDSSLRSLIGATIYFGDEDPVGFIGLYRDQEHTAFKEEEVSSVLQILSFGSKALEKFREMESNKQALLSLNLWKKLTRKFLLANTPEDLRKRYLDCVLQDFGADLGAFAELSEEKVEEFYGQNKKGEPREQSDFPYFERAIQVLREMSKPTSILIGTDQIIGISTKHQLVADLNLLSIIVIPLVMEKKLVGAVYFEKTLATNSFSEAEMLLAQESCEAYLVHFRRY